MTVATPGKVRVGKRVSASGSRSASGRRRSASTAAHVEAQNALYVAPWVLALLLGVVGQVLFVLWGEAPWQWLTQVGMGLATGAVAYAGWLDTKARTKLALGHTLVTIILTGVWLLLCSETGMFRLERVSWADWRMPVAQHPTLDLYILGAVSLCIAWNMHQGVHAKEAKDAAAAGETMDEWGEAGHPGVRGHLKKKNEFFLEGTLLLPRGETLQHLQANHRSIESAHDWPANSLTLLPLSRSVSSRRIMARVMIQDPLAGSVSYLGPEVGRRLTLFHPIRTGMRADGVVSSLYVAKPEGAKHFLIQGMSGAGKTQGQYPVLLECANRGAVQVVIDTVSGIQMFGMLAPALQWLIVDEGMAKAVLKRLADVVLTARMEQLARERKKTWDPTSSLRFLRIHIEEAWALLDSDYLMAISVTARKAGVQLVVSLQRASHDQLNTTVREQLGTRMCYGLGGQFGTMILDDEVLDAGANPVQWKDEQPGMHYMTRGGLSVAEKATAVRSYNDDGPVKFEGTASKLASRVSEMDEVTAQAFGSLWSQRVSPVELMRRAEEVGVPVTPPPAQSGSPGAAVVLPKVPQQVVPSANGHPASGKVSVPRSSIVDVLVEPDMGTGDDVDVPQQFVGEDFEPAMVEVILSEDGMTATFTGDGLPPTTLGYSHEDTAPEIVGDFDDDFADLADLPKKRLAPVAEKVSRMELDARMQGRLTELSGGSQSVVHSGHFVPLLIEAGYVRTMVYKYLEQWESDGLLHKLDDGGGWIFVRR